jgi:hypothetical protein
LVQKRSLKLRLRFIVFLDCLLHLVLRGIDLCQQAGIGRIRKML